MTDGYQELVRFVREQEHADPGERLRGLDFRSFLHLVWREIRRRVAAKFQSRFRA